MGASWGPLGGLLGRLGAYLGIFEIDIKSKTQMARHTKAQTHFRKSREILDRLVNRFWRGPETANFDMSVGEYDRKKREPGGEKVRRGDLGGPERER